MNPKLLTMYVYFTKTPIKYFCSMLCNGVRISGEFVFQNLKSQLNWLGHCIAKRSWQQIAPRARDIPTAAVTVIQAYPELKRQLEQ